MPQPYLSLVIPTRNDTYPGSLAQNHCLQILQGQLEEARIESEVIVVEYNPDPSQPPLSESLTVKPGKYVTVRVITVAAGYHRRFTYWREREFHQTCAINIGLRRARGRFFVYRATDHIYSSSLVQFLARKALLEDCIYRCDRYDVDSVVLQMVSAENLQEITPVCERHIVHWHHPLPVHASYRIPTLHANACGDFLLMSRSVWMKLTGLREGRYPLFIDYDSLLLYAAHAAGKHQVLLPGACRVYKMNHGMKATARIRQEWSPIWQRLDDFLASAAGTTVQNWSRMIFNYPRRRDRTLEAAVLDSYERHFVLPALLWAHSFPFVQQNFGNWGLGNSKLPEQVLTRATWDEIIP